MLLMSGITVCKSRALQKLKQVVVLHIQRRFTPFCAVLGIPSNQTQTMCLCSSAILTFCFPWARDHLMCLCFTASMERHGMEPETPRFYAKFGRTDNNHKVRGKMWWVCTRASYEAGNKHKRRLVSFVSVFKFAYIVHRKKILFYFIFSIQNDKIMFYQRRCNVMMLLWRYCKVVYAFF